MKNHWLKRHKQKELMEDALIVYSIGRGFTAKGKFQEAAPHKGGRIYSAKMFERALSAEEVKEKYDENGEC